MKKLNTHSKTACLLIDVKTLDHYKLKLDAIKMDLESYLKEHNKRDAKLTTIDLINFWTTEKDKKIENFLDGNLSVVDDLDAINIAKTIGKKLHRDSFYYLELKTREELVEPYTIKSENNLADLILENKIKVLDIQEIIRFLMLELLSMTEQSYHYNISPNNEDAFIYYDRKVEEIENLIYSNKNLSKEDSNFYISLLGDINKYIKSYEIPGVSKKWREINPNLNYYDVAYDIMNDDPALYRKIVNKEMKVNLSIYPTNYDNEMRSYYFNDLEHDSKINKWNKSYTRFFQDELKKTLQLLFYRYDNMENLNYEK